MKVLLECPSCYKKTLEKNVYKNKRSIWSDLSKTLEKLGLGCITEYVCKECGYKRNE